MTPNARQLSRQRQIRVFNVLIRFSAFFAKRPALKPLSDFILRRFAEITFLTRKGKRQNNVAGLAKEWQRMFPSKAFVPIKETKDQTAYAEILGVCPVTAGGDVHACHRLMEYDRRLLQLMGGQFVVLQSKAAPAFQVCRVAIRNGDAQMDDLIPAHHKENNSAH